MKDRGRTGERPGAVRERTRAEPTTVGSDRGWTWSSLSCANRAARLLADERGGLWLKLWRLFPLFRGCRLQCKGKGKCLAAEKNLSWHLQAGLALARARASSSLSICLAVADERGTTHAPEVSTRSPASNQGSDPVDSGRVKSVDRLDDDGHATTPPLILWGCSPFEGLFGRNSNIRWAAPLPFSLGQNSGLAFAQSNGPF